MTSVRIYEVMTTYHNFQHKVQRYNGKVVLEEVIEYSKGNNDIPETSNPFSPNQTSVYLIRAGGVVVR